MARGVARAEGGGASGDFCQAGQRTPSTNHRTPRVLAIVLLVALCFAVGLLIQTTFGAHIKRAAQRLVLDKIPGHSTLHGFAARLADSDETASFQPALVEIEEALVHGFIVEQHSGNRCTVFIPSVPTPMAGAVYIIDNSRGACPGSASCLGDAVHLEVGRRE
jgi:uncharacterized membrane protein